jgi:hypothetical protein
MPAHAGDCARAEHPCFTDAGSRRAPRAALKLRVVPNTPNGNAACAWRESLARRSSPPWRLGEPPRRRPEARTRTARLTDTRPRTAMATNVTTLALLLPAAKEISSADVEIAAEAVLVLVLVGLVAMPALAAGRPDQSRPRSQPAWPRCSARSDRSPRSGITVGLLGAAGLFMNRRNRRSGGTNSATSRRWDDRRLLIRHHPVWRMWNGAGPPNLHV